MPALEKKYFKELYPLKAIHNDEDYRYALKSMESVFDETDGRLAEYAETLAILIEYYEDAHFQINEEDGVEILKFLMDQNNLKQKDIVGIIGGKSTVSEVLSGKRPLNLHHIKALSEKFNVKMSTFV
ncbi:MAG: transcriptional regulator [Deltaproteobacteria bacterium]|nr:MAG: transcriptional regulator [Deltaproteobacteria bacterium]